MSIVEIFFSSFFFRSFSEYLTHDFDLEPSIRSAICWFLIISSEMRQSCDIFIICYTSIWPSDSNAYIIFHTNSNTNTHRNRKYIHTIPQHINSNSTDGFECHWDKTFTEVLPNYWNQFERNFRSKLNFIHLFREILVNWFTVKQTAIATNQNQFKIVCMGQAIQRRSLFTHSLWMSVNENHRRFKLVIVVGTA